MEYKSSPSSKRRLRKSRSKSGSSGGLLSDHKRSGSDGNSGGGGGATRTARTYMNSIMGRLESDSKFQPGLWLEIIQAKSLAVSTSTVSNSGAAAENFCKIIGKTKNGKFPFIQQTDGALSRSAFWEHVTFLSSSDCTNLSTVTIEVWSRGELIDDFLGEIVLRMGKDFRNGKPQEKWYKLSNNHKKNRRGIRISGSIKVSVLYQSPRCAAKRSRHRKHVKLVQADNQIQLQHRNEKFVEADLAKFHAVFQTYGPDPDTNLIGWQELQSYMYREHGRELTELQCRLTIRQCDTNLDGAWDFREFCLREARRQRLITAFNLYSENQAEISTRRLIAIISEEGELSKWKDKPVFKTLTSSETISAESYLNHLVDFDLQKSTHLY